MDKLVEAVSKAPKTRSKNDDDFADRLSSRYTVVLLIVFAVLVGLVEVRKARFPLPEFTARVDGCPKMHPSSRAVNSARELGP